MIERLQRALERVEELSPEAQNDLAQEIEELTEELPLPHAPGSAPTADEDSLPAAVRAALAVIGSARDQQDIDEFEALDRIRHESTPTPPIDLGDL
jgi:hypothetical protein